VRYAKHGCSRLCGFLEPAVFTYCVRSVYICFKHVVSVLCCLCSWPFPVHGMLGPVVFITDLVAPIMMRLSRLMFPTVCQLPFLSSCILLLGSAILLFDIGKFSASCSSSQQTWQLYPPTAELYRMCRSVLHFDCLQHVSILCPYAPLAGRPRHVDASHRIAHCSLLIRANAGCMFVGGVREQCL